MTCKDYAIIARGLAKAYSHPDNTPDMRFAVGNAIIEIGTELKVDNARFDSGKFVAVAMGTN